MTDNRVVQSLWIGNRLGAMERLAICSFLRHGHEFHLYTYGPVEGLPPETTVRDANEILPSESVFAYQSGFGKGSFSAFSNRFRYKLLLERGGWWVDTDVVCLRYFDLPQSIVLTTERLDPGTQDRIVSSAVMKLPPRSDLMRWAWEECLQTDPATVTWGVTGPKLMQRGVERFDLHTYLQPVVFASSIPHWDWRSFIAPIRPELPRVGVYGAHLFHQMWIEGGVNPDQDFSPTSLYEGWKRRFLSEDGLHPNQLPGDDAVASAQR